MSINFAVEVSGKLYEISYLVKSISYTDKLNDGCSKLEFSYVDDSLSIQNGSIVKFTYDDTPVFYGYVFKHSHDKNGIVEATAYDQLRYCKAKDTIIVKKDTVTTLVNKMCLYFGLNKKNLTDTGYVLPQSAQDSKTWLDIIYTAISDTLMAKGIKYCLRDEFGSIAIRNLTELTLNLVLGDESYCYDFSYEKSIDDEFYNQIKLASDNETSGHRDVYIVKDSKSISTYGLLQYFDVLDKNYNKSQAKAMADALLGLYNREYETISLECLGDTRVRAGSSFYTYISDLSINKRLIVNEVTHDFIPVHTMKVEVSI